MLIKRKKLTNINSAHGVNVVEISETSRAAQLEIQKAKQEARVIKQEAQSILEESQKKLKEAEEKAREIINTTNIEAKKIKEKVYQETLQIAKKESELIKAQARDLLKQLLEVKRTALTQAHNEIIKVALDLAEKIIRYKASIDPNVLKTQVIEAIKKATSEAERVKVYVNPMNLKALEANIPEMEKLFPSGVDIVPLTNDSVDPGSCIVETKSGQLDASFSAQLTALIELATHLEIKEPVISISDDIESTKVNETEKKEEVTIATETEEVFLEEEKEQLKEELLEVIQEIEKPQVSSQRKKLVIDSSLTERTREEAEELDEMDFGFEDDEEQEEETTVTKPKNVLKPKRISHEVSNIAQEIEQSKEWKDLIQEENE